MTVNTTNSAVGRTYESPDRERSWMEMCLDAQKQYMITQAKNFSLSGFCDNYLDTMEGMLDTNPDLLSPEHKEEYISCAQFMEDNYGRKINRIKEVKATL